jgi:hypothetical protein
MASGVAWIVMPSVSWAERVGQERVAGIARRLVVTRAFDVVRDRGEP